MATEGVVAEAAPEKPVQQETGELSGGQHPGPLKLEKEISGNLADNAAPEIDEKVKKVDLSNGTKIGDVDNIDCGALIRATDQSISEDPSLDSKAVQSIYPGYSGCSEGEDFSKSPLNIQVSLDEKISESLNAGLDEEKPFEVEKEMVKNDTLCQNDNIGEMEKNNESTEREHSSEANEKETCDATLARQRRGEWSSEREKEAKVWYEETLELASRQRIIGNNVKEVPPVAVKGLDRLNLQEEELDNEIAFSKDSPEVEACNKLKVFEINKEASNTYIDQKCKKIVHESGFTAERTVKDEEKKLEGYSYVESEGIGHAVSKTTKDEYDTAQESEAQVYISIVNAPTLQESPRNQVKDELRPYKTDKPSDMDQKKNVDILAHIIPMKKKYEDCNLLDDATQEKNTVSDVKEKSKKSDELQEKQLNASEDTSDSMASHVTNLLCVQNKIKDTEEETIQMDGAIQQTGIEEKGTNNGLKLNNVLCATDETTVTKVESEDEKVEDRLNVASETKQPETIEANDKILKRDKDAGEGIHNVHHFVYKTEDHLHNSQCPTEVAFQNDEGQKVEVKELSESLPDERILPSTAMTKTKDETTTDRTALTVDTLNETFQCDEIVDELQGTSQGKEENESVTVIHLTEVDHERALEVSSTACKEVDGNTVEDEKEKNSSDIELYAQDLSKTDRELDMETEKSQDRDLSEDHKPDRNIIKSIDAERTKENTSVQGDETAEFHEEQSSDKNEEIITLDHGILEENTTDAKEFDTSSSAESTGEKCLKDKHQQNEKTEAIHEIMHKEDKFYKEKDIDEVDSKADECNNLQGSDSHSEESLKQTGTDCEPSKTETQEDVGLTNMESSAREKVNGVVPMSNTGKCKDTEQAYLVACEQKDGDDQKHDNHPKTLSLGDEIAEGHTCTEKEQIYKEPSCSKQEEETRSDKHKEETGDPITGCQENSKIANLGEKTKNSHTKEEMRNEWTIIKQESKKTNDLTEDDKTQEDDPDKSNALLPTYESVRKTLEEEEHIMQKEIPGPDTQEAIPETTNTNITIRTGCENDETSPVEPQPTFERTEEDESISNVPLKEQSESETDQEASSTVSKGVGRITDEDAQNKVYPETELCAQDISEDDIEVTVHDDEISVPSEHLPFNEDMTLTTLVGDEVLKVATDRKFVTSSSVQFPEDECLLYEHQENEKVAATSEMIQQEEESHKVINLYEVDNHDKKCNMQSIVDPQADETSENIGPDYGQFQTNTQEDCKLTIIESSEMIKMKQGALKSNAEYKEHIENNDERNSKADILIDETDGQMHDHQEPLSLGDDAAGGSMYTEREHIYKEPKCTDVLEIISQEGKREGDKLEEEIGKQTLNNHETSNSKQGNSSEDAKNALIEDTKEVVVPEQDNKRADDVKVTNEDPMEDGNAHLNITNELIEEAAKRTLNHQETSKQDNSSEETKFALTGDTKEDTVSEPENKRTEDLKETNEKHMDDSIADLDVTNELVEEAGKQTLGKQETKRTHNLKETNEEYTGESNAHQSVTKESVKETLDNQEIRILQSSKQDHLSEETKTALTKETKEATVPKQKNSRTDDIKQTNEEYTDESDTHLSVIDELAEEAVKQTLDNQENKRTDDIKLTNEKHMDGSSVHLNVTTELVEEAGKQTLDNQESSGKDTSSEKTQNALRETKVVTVSDQENKRKDDLKETNEEYTDESDAHVSVTNELDEEEIKQTLHNQESSNQGNLSEETQNALAEETQEVKVPDQENSKQDNLCWETKNALTEETKEMTVQVQENKSIDDIKETNEEHTDEGNGHLSVTDELVEEAVKQTLDKQGGSKQDNLSEEAKDALIEETKEDTVIGQENKITDSIKVTNVEHVDVGSAHLNVTDELVEEAGKQTLDNQESSEQDILSTETKVAVTEESKGVTVQENKSTDDLKESNKEHMDESNAHLDVTNELVGEAVKQTPNNQQNMSTDDVKETNMHTHERNTHLNVTDELVGEAVKQRPGNQENKRTDDVKVTIEEHMDGNNAHVNAINELVEVAGKQTLDNQESSKQDNLSGETKNAHTEQTNVVIAPEHENKGTDDLKKTNEEHTDESSAHLCVTNELVEETDKQTLENENSKQDILCEETKNVLKEESKEVTVPAHENKRTNYPQKTNEEHTDESNFVTDEIVEEAIKQTLNNQEARAEISRSSKQDNLSDNSINALTEDTKEVTVPKQENKRTDDLKDTNEKYMDESNAHLSVTHQLAEEEAKQTCRNQESSKQDQLSEDTQNACMEGIRELNIPEQQNKKTDDLKETNEEHKDQSSSHLTATDELVEKTQKAGTMQKETGSNRKQVIHEATNNHVAVETRSFHAAEPQFCKDTVGYKEGNLKGVAQSDEDREHLPFEEAAASVETCTEKETSKELDFSKITARNNQEEKADKLHEEANDAQSDKDHEPLPFGDAVASRETCTEKEDACKELDCSNIIETNIQEEEEEADKLQEAANGQPTEDQENSNFENLDRETENAHVNEEKNQDIVTLEQEKKSINDLKEEYITDEENPDKSNGFSPETHKPAEKTQEEEDAMQKESRTTDTEETVHETPDIQMTPGSRDGSLVELQKIYRRTEEDESTSYNHIKEEEKSSRDQEDSSTVSKEIAGNTDRATQSKTSLENKICMQEISKDNNEPDVQGDKTILPLEQLTFDKNHKIITSADVELLKEGTSDAEKYETSSPIQPTIDKCLLNEHEQNEKPAVTAEIIQEKDQSHRDMELYEGDSHAKECNTICVPDSQAEIEKTGSEYEPSPTDPQEYDSLPTMESPEREELNQGAPKSNTEECEHIPDNKDEILKAVTQSDERDGQKIHNHYEPLSSEVNALGNKEMGFSSSSQKINDDSFCLTFSESGNNIYLKNHTEDMKENISENKASTKLHEVTLTSEVTEEMLQDEENREKGREEEETPQECEPTSNAANEILIGQIKESISKQSRHTPDAMDSEESMKVTSLEMVGDEIENSTKILPGGPELSHEAVSRAEQHTQVEMGEAEGQESIDEVDGIGTTTADSETSEDGEHEVESCSVLKEQSIENTNKQKVEETERPEPYPVSNSLCENKEIKKTKDEAPSMNNQLSADTDVATEQITSEEIDDEFVVSKENNNLSASDEISSAEISDEAKDIMMASANLLSTNILDTADAKEESSNSVVLMSQGEVVRQEAHGEEQTQEFNLISSEKTKQNINSNEDNESNSKFLEHHDETVDLSEEIDTEGYRGKGQNKSPAAELPADDTTTTEVSNKFEKSYDSHIEVLKDEGIDTEGYRGKGQNKSPAAELPADDTTTTEVSNKFEKSYDSPIEVLKNEDTKGKLFQDISSFTIAMEVGEPTADNKKEKQEMGFVRSVLYNETTAGDVSLQKAEEFDNKSVTASEKTESTDGRHGSTSQEVHVLAASGVSNLMACNKDAVQLLDASIVVFNKQIENADSQEITMQANRPELPPCKQEFVAEKLTTGEREVMKTTEDESHDLANFETLQNDKDKEMDVSYLPVSQYLIESVAEKLTTGEREVMKTTEDESHDLANFETLQNDKDKEMDVSYLPVSQYLIDRIMREEDEKNQNVVQEDMEDGHEGMDIKTKELNISSDKHERLEEFVSQNIDGGVPKSKVSSLPAAMETSVEDTKREVFLSENLIDIVPKDGEKHATTENNKTQSELKNGESTGLGPRTHEKSEGAAEVMEQKITLNDNKALTNNPDSPSVAEIDSSKISEGKCPKYAEATEIQPNIQMLEEMEQKITLNDKKALTKNPDSLSVAEIDSNKMLEQDCLKYVEAREIQPNIEMLEEMEQKVTLNDSKALTKNPDSPSAAEIDNNKIPQEENCPIYVEARDLQPNIQMPEEAIIEEHPPETIVTGIHENLLKTQEPPRPVLEGNQVLEDSLEFAADIKEVKIMGNKHDGISDAQVEGSIEKTNLSNLGEAHPSGSEKEPINHNNQTAKSILEEKSLATNRDELAKDVLDTQVVFHETKNFNGTDETLLKTQEPSTTVQEVNQVVQDALEFAPAEKEMKTQMNDKTDGIVDAQMDSTVTVEEPNERAKLSDKKHTSESEKDSIDDNIQIAEGTLEEKNLAINRDELDKEPIHMRDDEDTCDEEVEKDLEENETDKSGAHAPLTVETRDEGPKTALKKPHNILSGVKSKVKHSIAKVKKAITGKSSHSKTAPTK